MDTDDSLLNRLNVHVERYTGDRFKSLRYDLHLAIQRIEMLEATTQAVDVVEVDVPTEVVTTTEPETEALEPVPVESTWGQGAPIKEFQTFDYDEVQDHEEQPPEAYDTTPKKKWWQL